MKEGAIIETCKKKVGDKIFLKNLKDWRRGENRLTKIKIG